MDEVPWRLSPNAISPHYYFFYYDYDDALTCLLVYSLTYFLTYLPTCLFIDFPMATQDARGTQDTWNARDTQDTLPTMVPMDR